MLYVKTEWLMLKNHKPILNKIITFFFLIIFSSFHSAYALPYCSLSGKMSSNGWSMSPPGSSFSNGQVIGSTTASVTYTMPVPQNLPILIAGSTTAEYNEYNTIPMLQTPGVGVRIKWGGYYATAGINVSLQVPHGTILTRKYWQEIFKATSRSSFQITFRYNYEIVIIDKEKYKGGKLIITDSTPALSFLSTARPGTNPQTCMDGWVNLLTAVTNELSIPELPEPAKPTCASTNLGYTVPLNPIKASDITSYGSSRSSGAASEQEFRLIGYNCAPGTVIKAYFTDSRSQSSTEDYLSSTNPSTGIRLYNHDSQTPIRFGPAPIGSTLPSRSPIIEGPATATSSTLYYSITAQYVRRPGFAAGDVKPGELRAATTVTFVYD